MPDENRQMIVMAGEMFPDCDPNFILDIAAQHNYDINVVIGR